MGETICVLCALYHPNSAGHPPDRTQTCDAGRRRLERDRLSVRSLLLRLIETEPVVLSSRDGARDPVAAALPMAVTPSRSTQPVVSGSRERKLPIDVSALDLTAGASSGPVVGWHDDQAGYISVATVLQGWVQRWRATLFTDQRAPLPNALALLDWIGGVRLEVICESEPLLADFAQDIGALRAGLRAALGEVPPRPQIMWGIPCRRCGLVSQLVLDLDDPDRYRECANCELLMTEDEYKAYLLHMVEGMRTGRRNAARSVADGEPV